MTSLDIFDSGSPWRNCIKKYNLSARKHNAIFKEHLSGTASVSECL